MIRSESVTILLFEAGKFGVEDTLATSQAMWAYSAGTSRLRVIESYELVLLRGWSHEVSYVGCVASIFINTYYNSC